MIRLKGSVRVPRTLTILTAASNAAELLALPRDPASGAHVFVTSGNDSRHMPESLHYLDRALDFRTNHLSPEQQRAWTKAIQERLGRDYQAILEDDHLHVEHDPPITG